MCHLVISVHNYEVTLKITQTKFLYPPLKRHMYDIGTYNLQLILAGRVREPDIVWPEPD